MEIHKNLTCGIKIQIFLNQNQTLKIKKRLYKLSDLTNNALIIFYHFTNKQVQNYTYGVIHAKWAIFEQGPFECHLNSYVQCHYTSLYFC